MTLSRWWLLLFPLLYLPNLGFASATAFGTLEVSDFLIGPYIALVLFAVHKQGARQYQRLWPWLLGFVLVAFVSTATIWWRYPVTSSYPVTFGLLKLGKLSLYGVAGVLTARALSLPRHRSRFDWALLAGAVVVAISLLAMPDRESRWDPSGANLTYNSLNAISVSMAIMFVWLTGRIWFGGGTERWRRVALWTLPVLLLGFSLSDGRGGWVAALAGLFFLLVRSEVSRRVVAVVALGVCTLGFAYVQFPQFKEDVDRTLWPDQEFLARYGAGVAGVDDGARPITWANEVKKFPDAPILGTGFFHRGGASGLWTTGSHNFWLQMLLESGAVGFGVLSIALWMLWRQARRCTQRDCGVALQAALVAALVGGLSGEYFYGGMVLFTLLAVYAPVGGERSTVCMRAARTADSVTSSAWYPGAT